MTDYNPIAVDKAIEASNRSRSKIGKREAKAIHRLLAGRTTPSTAPQSFKAGSTLKSTDQGQIQ
jgi:hypothetical protein